MIINITFRSKIYAIGGGVVEGVEDIRVYEQAGALLGQAQNKLGVGFISMKYTELIYNRY